MNETETPKQLSSIRCAGCGEFIPAGRSTRQFHDSSCRARFWRRKRDIVLHSELIQKYIAEWEAMLSAGQCVDEIERQFTDIAKTMVSCHRWLLSPSWQQGLFDAKQ